MTAIVIFAYKVAWSKQGLKNKNKIKRLLIEQKILLDNIPDGAMIYNFNKLDNKTEPNASPQFTSNKQ